MNAQFKNRKELYDTLSTTGVPIFWRQVDANNLPDDYIVFSRSAQLDELNRDNQIHIKKVSIDIELHSKRSDFEIDNLLDEIGAGFINWHYDKDTMEYITLYQVNAYTAKGSNGHW